MSSTTLLLEPAKVSCRELRQAGPIAMKTNQTPPLPARRAFVVQFRAEADVELGQFVGRVEHVVSGQAASFRSLQELEAFFARVLTRPSAEPSEEP